MNWIRTMLAAYPAVRIEPQCCDEFCAVRLGRQVLGGIMWTPDGWYYETGKGRMEVYFAEMDECVSALLSEACA